MENVKGPTSTHPKPQENRNDNKENKLHSLKEVPKRGFIQIKESFRTLKNVNRQPVNVKGIPPFKLGSLAQPRKLQLYY